MTVRLQEIAWAPAAGVALLCVALGVVAGIDPRMGVVAALGIALLVLTFADLTAGLVIFVAVVFAESSPIAGPALSFTKMVGLVLVLGWIARVATRPAAREQLLPQAHPTLFYVLVALVGWAMISLAWAPSDGEGINEASVLLLVVILYVIVYTAVPTAREAVLVIGTFAAGAAGTAAYGLVVRPANEGGNTERFVSTIQDPNFLAAILVAGFALAAAGFVAARGYPGLRLAAASAAGLCLLGFLLTGSRGGLVAFTAALVTAVLLGGRWRRMAVAAAIAVVLGASAYYTLYAPEAISDRVISSIGGEASGSDIEAQESRVTIWTVALRMVEDNLVQGVGVGGFQAASADYVLEPGSLFRTDRIVDDPALAHNTYLQVLAELGVVGAALFLAVIAFSVASALKAARTFASRGDWRMEVMARGLLVAIVGVLAANIFVSSVAGKILWLLLALGPALLAIARSGESSDRDPAARPAG